MRRIVRHTNGVTGRTLLWVVGFAMSVMLMPAFATAIAPPHVVTETDTDACAMCHRAHSSASTIDFEGSDEATYNALIVGVYDGTAGDVLLCYACHGVDQLGSGTDVESSFEATSHHVLAPVGSAYGPSPKRCGHCHDAHGTARDGNDEPFTALLETQDASGTAINSGDAYCSACHGVRDVLPLGRPVLQRVPHRQVGQPVSRARRVAADRSQPRTRPRGRDQDHVLDLPRASRLEQHRVGGGAACTAHTLCGRHSGRTRQRPLAVLRVSRERAGEVPGRARP